MTAHEVSEFVRRRADTIIRTWMARITREVPETRAMNRPALLDHLPEFLPALASWIDGDLAGARRGFERLAEGHALQRLGHGITLEGLTEEYAVLREVLLEEIRAVPSTDQVRDDLIRLNLGMDKAVNEAVQRYARRRDEIRERFIGILGHDLRNPLSAIAMAAEAILHDEDAPPRYLTLGARIVRGTSRMQEMVEQLLAFAQGHLGGGIPAEPVPCDLGDLARAAFDEATAAFPDRDIRLAATGDLRGSWDPARVHQALSNLIGNAIAHGDDPVELAVRADGDDHVISEVTNRGAPIPRDALPTLFDPFRRFVDDTRPRRAGLGLGLFIVNQIALAHGTTIDVASDAETGTKFTLRWPRTIPGHPGANPDLRGS